MKKLDKLKMVGLFVCMTSIAPTIAGLEAEERSQKSSKLWAYFGTYTGGASKGIYRCEFDLATGRLGRPELVAETKNPSFLAIHPSRNYLYAVGEVQQMGGKPVGGITAFSIDNKTGDLTYLNGQSSGGAGPCHVAVDQQGKYVLAANYSGGSAVVLPVKEGGRLGASVSLVQHKGSSVNPQRQKGPYAHSINVSPDNRFAFVADLGLDKVLIYKLNQQTGKLTAANPAFAATAPGAGPRHFTFHPSGKFAYVINELLNTVTAFRFNSETGELTETQTVTTLPAGFEGTSHCAEIVAHPSGNFVYGSNRGHDSIAIFRVDPQSGKLTPAGHQTHKIKTPRNFALDPTGQFLIACSQAANKVIVFRVDESTGTLQPTGNEVDIPVPVCVRFVPAP